VRCGAGLHALRAGLLSCLVPADTTGELWDGWRDIQSEFGYEAPTMFKRNGVYYAMFGYQCCFCEQGSGIRVYTATAPLGPYVYQGGNDLACHVAPEPTPKPAGGSTQKAASVSDLSWLDKTFVKAAVREPEPEPEPSPGQGCQHMDADAVSSTRSQQNFVFEVRGAIRGPGGRARPGLTGVAGGGRWSKGTARPGISGRVTAGASRRMASRATSPSSGPLCSSNPMGRCASSSGLIRLSWTLWPLKRPMLEGSQRIRLECARRNRSHTRNRLMKWSDQPLKRVVCGLCLRLCTLCTSTRRLSRRAATLELCTHLACACSSAAACA
jgi:hypothetical protein